MEEGPSSDLVADCLDPGPVDGSALLEVDQHQVVVRAARHQAVALRQQRGRHGAGVGHHLSY